jgi:hypothetical protein
MKKARTYIRRLNIDMNGFKNQYEDLQDANEDFTKITETRPLPEDYVMRLLDMRAF